MVDFFANCKLNRSSRRQSLAPCHLSPQQHRAAQPPSFHSSTPQLPNSPTHKLSNSQTVKLSNSQTPQLTNCQTRKLSNYQTSPPLLHSPLPNSSPLATVTLPEFFTLHSSLFTIHSSLFILHSSLFILHSSFNYNFCNCIFFISILYF